MLAISYRFQIKIEGRNRQMLLSACEQFLGKTGEEISNIVKETLEAHQRAIMGLMTVEEIFQDRQKFSEEVFRVASSDLFGMGISVVSYTIKDISDEQVGIASGCRSVISECVCAGLSEGARAEADSAGHQGRAHWRGRGHERR